MKRLTLAALLALTPLTVQAAQPSALGVYGAWTAASLGSGKSRICYAFTRARGSSIALHPRGTAMLAVTERHGAPDEVSVTPGYTYPKFAKVELTSGRTRVTFSPAGQNAYTADNSRAVAAFRAGSTAEVTATSPDHGRMVTDHYSLAGFSAAYGAIKRACP
ncbi:invasion associated locus B family protein [Acidocella sp.]|jgi:Tfp pilus assembly protein FimT|uniref:invasion associated locus B family protein n=1 Tax=Acidocella sp. TaxID=50710 RepID=UPI002605554D|nr:invasion associated locus B family protein [Acidocella sp.]